VHALEFSTVLNILFTFRSFEQLVVALENRVARNLSLHWNIFYYSRVLSNLRLPWKTGCPGIFHCVEYTFHIQEFGATCACPEKHGCLEIFSCIEYTFYIQNFWATCTCPEKQRGPWIHCTKYRFFYYSGVLSDLHLPWKTELPWNFSLCWTYFFTFMSSEQLALALKNTVALEFFTVVKYVLSVRIFD